MDPKLLNKFIQLEKQLIVIGGLTTVFTGIGALSIYQTTLNKSDCVAQCADEHDAWKKCKKMAKSNDVNCDNVKTQYELCIKKQYSD